MSLSASKLEGFLTQLGLLPRQYLTIDRQVIYVDVNDSTTNENFLVYIPSRYSLSMRGPNAIKLKFIEMDDRDKLAEEFAGEPDDIKLEKSYNEILLQQDDDDDGNMMEHLEQSYKKQLALRDMDKEVQREVRDLRRQLRRLSFCTRSVPYKVALFYKSYMCAVRRDDSLECFYIKQFDQPSRKLIIIADLEEMYDRQKLVSEDVIRVRDGVHAVMSRNHTSHVTNLRKMIVERQNISVHAERCQQLAHEYQRQINQFTGLVERLKVGEERLQVEIRDIEREYENRRGVHRDMEKSRRVNAKQRELRDLLGLKQNIVRTLIEVKNKRENILLAIDQIMFDSSVMFDAITQNFKALQTIG